ncbi:hypothetical protein [Thermococcus sp.]
MYRKSVYQDLEKFREKVWERTKKLETLLEQDTEQLRKEINSTLGYGPDLYFYQKTVSQTKHASSRRIRDLLLDEEFVELLYATLVSWGMHSRRARMKPFEEFSQSIQDNVDLFAKLADYHLRKRSSDENGLDEGVKDILDLFIALDIMKPMKKEMKEVKSKKVASKLVANSKLMHFILPHLVMPIDRKHIVSFFTGCRRVPLLEPEKLDRWSELDSDTKSEVRTFFKIHKAVSDWLKDKKISNKLSELLDDKWNQTIPKVIDNLIIYCKTHPEKCNRKR